MAYVVARRNGRFEVRESLHTPRGPRARTLTSFRVLTDEVLAQAARRAKRPFDAQAVLASGRRAGAEVKVEGNAGPWASASSDRFVQASRRMALAFQQPPKRRPKDPGAVLIDLLGFADAVAATQPPRPFEPLVFPVLPRLVEERRGAASRGGA
jgi:hypothetical protein